jgi:hypothetical protein
VDFQEPAILLVSEENVPVSFKIQPGPERDGARNGEENQRPADADLLPSEQEEEGETSERKEKALDFGCHGSGKEETGQELNGFGARRGADQKRQREDLEGPEPGVGVTGDIELVAEKAKG